MRISDWSSDVCSSDLTARQLCLEIEALLPDVVCTLMTVDPAGLLHPLATPSLPDAYALAIDGVMIGPEVGSCGTAAYMRKTVGRSEERRVGNECVSTCRYRGSPDHTNKNNYKDTQIHRFKES